jgi:hypothetical protein
MIKKGLVEMVSAGFKKKNNLSPRRQEMTPSQSKRAYDVRSRREIIEEDIAFKKSMEI